MKEHETQCRGYERPRLKKSSRECRTAVLDLTSDSKGIEYQGVKDHVPNSEWARPGCMKDGTARRQKKRKRGVCRRSINAVKPFLANLCCAVSPLW